MTFSKEWIESGAALDSLYILEQPVDFLTLLSKYPLPMHRPDGGNDGSGRCTLCQGPLMWGGTAYDPHTRLYHAQLRRRLLQVVAVIIRRRIEGAA